MDDLIHVQERLAAVKNQPYLVLVREVPLLDEGDKSARGFRGQIVFALPRPLETVPAGKITLQIQDHDGIELPVHAVQVLDEVQHLALFRLCALDKEPELRQRLFLLACNDPFLNVFDHLGGHKHGSGVLCGKERRGAGMERRGACYTKTGKMHDDSLIQKRYGRSASPPDQKRKNNSLP